MRARGLKPSLFKNEILGAADPIYSLIFEGLWCLADREGRLEDRPLRIHVEINPYRAPTTTTSALEWLHENGFILRYEASGIACIAIPGFAKHQMPHHMEARSVLPAPDGISDRFNHEPITKRQRADILERDGHQCVECHSKKDLHIDHIIPVSAGGGSDNANLRVLCGKCNLMKGKKIIDVGTTTSRQQVDIDSTSSRSCALTPSSLTADSGLLTADTSPPARAREKPPKVPREAPPDWFLDFKLAYPERAGDPGWRKAERAANARMAEGHSVDEFIAGAQRYAAFVDETGKRGTEYVKQASTFLGPDKHFLLPWTSPARPETDTERLLRLNSSNDRTIEHEASH